jgi:hypothetical protein
MTKVMFQIGLLSFFVSAVIFGIQGLAVMDMIARAFIVFIAMVAGQLIVLVVASGMKRAPERPAAAQASSRSDDGSAVEQEPPATQTSATAA